MNNLIDIKIPSHLAIILDGNGRWAKQRGLKRILGHKAGVEALRETIKASFDLGVKYLSVYCFSTENWKRDKEEVDYLFTLPKIYFDRYINYFLEKDIRIIISGNLNPLPESTRNSCLMAIEKTKKCQKGIFNVCFNYGSHDEILKACKEIALEVKEGKININQIDEKLFENHLYTKDLPPVDLLIRTSNEQRISNFLLWQISYAEIYFTKTFWPDFNKDELIKAFKEYTNRDRRFGGIKNA